MATLILLRHGQSMWNAANRFTGWVDVPLSRAGIDEALDAGRRIADLPIDEVHMSTLLRAQQTAMIALAERSDGRVPRRITPQGEVERHPWSHLGPDAEDDTLPIHVTWRLNERMYGDLQGLDKGASRARWGEDQVHIWRRSYDVPPPNGESLAMTAERTVPYLEEVLLPALDVGRSLLVVAHGNSLRSLIMRIRGLTEEEVIGLELPTGVPLRFERIEGAWSTPSAMGG